ncbi:MAG: hypothetical protein ACLQF0_10530 [Dissulfurispiraceae bacterium]
MKRGGFVKSPYAALRFILRRCGVRTSTPHSSGFARLASGAFYKTAFFLLAVLVLVACGKKGEPTFITFVKPPPVNAITVVHRENSMLLSWSYSVSQDMQELIKGFYIEKAVAGGDNKPGEFRELVFLPGTVNHYTDKDFEAGRPYFYKIRVYSVRNIISDPSPVVKVVPAELPPSPQGLFFKIKNYAVEIRWDKLPGKVKYNIYRSNKKDVFQAVTLNKAALSEPLFMDKVETGSHLYYKVTSLLDTGIKDEGFPSEVLDVDPGTFVPSKPSGLKYVYAPKGVVLMWNENPESWVKLYRVYRKRASESSFSIIGEAVTPTFKDNDPVTSKTLYYITALGPSRESAAQEPIEVSPLVER